MLCDIIAQKYNSFYFKSTNWLHRNIFYGVVHKSRIQKYYTKRRNRQTLCLLSIGV